MRIKEGLVLREVAGRAVVIPVGDASKELSGMIKLNATGRLVWEGVAAGRTAGEIAAEMMDRFEVDEATARADVDSFVSKMSEAGLLEG